MDKPLLVEHGVYRIPLRLPVPLERRRHELERILLDAQRRLSAFAAAHGWGGLVSESFADRAAMFDSKEAFDRAAIEVCELDPSTRLLPTACAALERRVLMAVSPELYAEIYPEGVEDGSFDKLLAHEMAHRLHIRILGGDEDAMGPVWFFEGFAIHAAGQFQDSAPGLSRDEIWAIVRSDRRGSYKRYATVLRYFLTYASIAELVARAGRQGLLDWLGQIEHR
jgi:hypothetical protein